MKSCRQARVNTNQPHNLIDLQAYLTCSTHPDMVTDSSTPLMATLPHHKKTAEEQRVQRVNQFPKYVIK